jgi:hypothetical protein
MDNMSRFFDKQGILVLSLVLLLAFGYLVAFVATRAPKVTPEEVVQNYLAALQRGDVQAAYALLSTADREFLDIERFKSLLTRQPQVQLLFGGSDLYRGSSLPRSLLRYELVEADPNKQQGTKQQGTKQYSKEVLMRVTLPDITKVLGQSLLQFYLFGEAYKSLSPLQNLEVSRRVEASLQTLETAPTLTSYQRFHLIQSKGQWQLSVPEWRVEALLYEAKENLIHKNTEEAGLLLDQASNFGLQVDDLTRTTLVRKAIEGKHMLKYIPWVRVTAFRLGLQDAGCAYPVTLTLENRGERPVRSAEIAVLFLDKKQKPIDNQVLSLDRQTVSKQAGVFLPAAESVTTKVCLTPPRKQEWFAESHVVWLEFAESTD